jgi:hypothetical protein
MDDALIKGTMLVKICGDSTRVVHPLFQTEDGGSLPTSPLHLHVGKISLSLAAQLNKLWHSVLPIIDTSSVIRHEHYICFGAEYSNCWYATAIWSSPSARRLSGKTYLELRRFAIAPDAPKNTASRMLGIMKRQISQKFPHLKTLCSYQDVSHHAGTIYKAGGWLPKTVPANTDTWWDNNATGLRTVKRRETIRWELQLSK